MTDVATVAVTAEDAMDLEEALRLLVQVYGTWHPLVKDLYPRLWLLSVHMKEATA
jgi:hypothetical protein